MNKVFFAILLLAWWLHACRQEESLPVVHSVYPTSDTLPENLLRMYLLFSQPMKTVGNLEKIRLLDQEGREVQGAIFNNTYELWNEQQTRLTLILDPARVKSGLAANESLGRALKVGEEYQLEVGLLEDANHKKMPTTFTKSFFVTVQDTIPPSPDRWRIHRPRSGTYDALTIDFPRPLDAFSMQQRIAMIDETRNPIAGKVSIEKRECQWVFEPDQKWDVGRYEIVVNARLEDAAGNNLNGRFEHDTGSLTYEKEGALLFLPMAIQ